MDVALTLPPTTELDEVAARAAQAEELGAQIIHVPEMTHDSLMVAALAINATDRLRVRTSMTLAFPRSPMITAYAAWDLARFSRGRFELGLATQVRGNIVGRFGLKWSDPALWLGDYLDALEAIFTGFARGGGIDYHGSHYSFTRLQPAFTPDPLEFDPPPICVGGVGPKMVELAGRRAARLVTHATNSHPRYLAEVVAPALQAGAQAADRLTPPMTVVPMCVSAPDEAALPAARKAIREQLAFLFSTPNYQATLAILELEELGERLSRMAKKKQWDQLPEQFTDDVIARIVPEATWAKLPETLIDWYGPWADQICLPWPTEQVERFADEVIAPLNEHSEGPRLGAIVDE